jgi:hypothetical protein
MLATFASALALMILAGCSSSPWHKVPLDAASGFYADAELTYRLDAGKLGQPLDVVRVEGQRVSYEQVPSSPLGGESIGTLQVIFPHPAGRAGYALARFSLDSTRPKPAPTSRQWNPFVKRTNSVQAPATLVGTHPEIHETWELDIENVESNRIFKLLTDLGFYQSEKPGAAARVSVKMQGKEQAKDWDQIPALNLLIQRVRTQGRLVAFARPAGQPGSVTDTIASTEAYRQLMAQRGVAPGALMAPTSAFSLSPSMPMLPGQPPAPAAIAQQPRAGAVMR